MDTRQQFINGLRELANFYEKSPDIPHPITNPTIGVYHLHSKEQAATVARLLGDVEKEYDDTLFRIQRTFGGPGGLRLSFVFYRSNVCRKVVIETRVIPAHTLPAQEQVDIPEQIEEVTEWRCDSLLGGVQ